MRVAIINYGAGNTRSVLFGLERLGVSAVITDRAEEIQAADKIILPGVGEAASAMEVLRKKKLGEVICSLKQPVLGICLGMQLLCQHSEEGDTPCLGVFEQSVKRFSPEQLKVPQVGWNTVSSVKTDLFIGIKEQEYFYFVHGYYVGLSENTIAKTHYGFSYSSAMKHANFYGVQFHPEKSAAAGLILLKNFISL